MSTSQPTADPRPVAIGTDHCLYIVATLSDPAATVQTHQWALQSAQTMHATMVSPDRPLHQMLNAVIDEILLNVFDVHIMFARVVCDGVI